VFTLISLYVARRSIVAFLQHAVSIGYLEIHDGAHVVSFGRLIADSTVVRLVVVKDAFWTRVFHSGDLGCLSLFSFIGSSYLADKRLVSEAYMMGEVHIIGDDLVSVMNVCDAPSSYNYDLRLTTILVVARQRGQHEGLVELCPSYRQYTLRLDQRPLRPNSLSRAAQRDGEL
jgi:hypothetical protein